MAQDSQDNTGLSGGFGQIIKLIFTFLAKLLGFGGDEASSPASQQNIVPQRTAYVPPQEPAPEQRAPVVNASYTVPTRSSSGALDDTWSNLADNIKGNGRVDRSRFAAELQNPEVMRKFAGRMMTEVGNQGQAAQVAFAETVFNRALSRGWTIEQTLSGNYYPTLEPKRSDNQNYKNAVAIALSGTNITQGATGNASGSVGFGRGGWQTASFGGERFGVEGVDAAHNWMAKIAPYFDSSYGGVMVASANTPNAKGPETKTV